MKSSQLRARYWRIVIFFARVTAGFIFWEIVLPKIGLSRWSRRTRSDRYRGVARRFRALAIRMGGLMIKVGQFLSARLDVLPLEITNELSGLQDEVPPETYEAIRVQAEAELGQPLAERYDWIDEAPLAAASLGQVHRARLCALEVEEHGFSEVVIKVQRPHIQQIVDVDLSALRRVGGWLQRYRPVAKRADVNALVEEFAATTLQEIDYLAEGGNAETFSANFADNPMVSVPRVVWSLTTRCVLTLEDVSAIKLTDYDAITAAEIDRSEVASVLLDTYLQQIFEDGFFHADPHPGNLFVTPLEGYHADGTRRWRLTFVDFGMVGHVPENLRIGLREVLVAVGTQDGPRLVQSFKTLGVLLPSADLKLIELASMQLFDRFWGMSVGDLRQIDEQEMMNFGLQFQELILDLPFQLPENLLLLGRTVGILSGMCSGLDPEFNLWTSLAPYANQLVSEEGTPGWQTWLGEGTKILQTTIGLPGRADRVLTLMERGELNVQTPRLDIQVRRVERSVGRLSGAIVFAALLIAGAILYPAEPLLATILMASSVVPLLWLLLAARRRPPGR
jgi:predicted unusual protein kinase regulating ubiquinone biosynthesis (AarF/ABC1/UbiB family)